MMPVQLKIIQAVRFSKSYAALLYSLFWSIPVTFPKPFHHNISLLVHLFKT